MARLSHSRVGLLATLASTWRSKRLLLLPIAFLVVVVFLLFTHHDKAQEFWKSLASLPAVSVASALALILVQVSFQALRLWAIISRETPVTLGTVAYAFSIGEFTNIWTPARAGDALKVVLMTLGQPDRNTNLARLTGAVLADKVVDVGTFVLFCSITGLFATGAASRLSSLWIALASGAVVLLLLFGIRLVRPSWLARLKLPVLEVLEGLSGLKVPLQVLSSVCFSLAAWVAELLALRILCAGVGFPVPIPGLLLALVILNASIFIPVSLANIGVYEAMLALGLSRSGVPLPFATAIATAHHALELVATTLSAAVLSTATHVFGWKHVTSSTPVSPCVSNTPSAP